MLQPQLGLPSAPAGPRLCLATRCHPPAHAPPRAGRWPTPRPPQSCGHTALDSPGMSPRRSPTTHSGILLRALGLWLQHTDSGLAGPLCGILWPRATETARNTAPSPSHWNPHGSANSVGSGRQEGQRLNRPCVHTSPTAQPCCAESPEAQCPQNLSNPLQSGVGACTEKWGAPQDSARSPRLPCGVALTGQFPVPQLHAGTGWGSSRCTSHW